MSLINLTRFAATLLPTFDQHGHEVALVLVAARFDLPTQPSSPPEPSVDQPGPPLADVYPGEPGVGGPVRAAQSTFTRPGGDIYLCGSIRPPEPATQLALELRVAEIAVQAWVFGERRWSQGLTGWSITSPLPFESMPIDWSRCAGHLGDERNPAGCHPPVQLHEGTLLPNFEDPRQIITTPKSPSTGFGLGPLPPHWQPRRGLAGTYDDAWQRDRAPYWPEDLDLHFFRCSPPHLQRAEPFTGGELVSMTGLLPRSVHFALPALRIRFKARLRGNRMIDRVRFDCLEIDLDAGVFTLFGRASVVLHRGFGALDEVVIRELRSWEHET